MDEEPEMGANNGSDAAAIIAMAKSHAVFAGDEVEIAEDTRFLVVPDGATLMPVDHLHAVPRAMDGTASFWMPQGLIDYVEHAGKDRAVCYVSASDVRPPSITAVIDHHGDLSPQWGRHRAVYTARQSAKFNAWTALNRKPMTQEALAIFLEDHAEDVAAPSGAELLEIVSTLQVTANVAFKRGTRLSDGRTQLIYQEEATAKAGRGGDLTVPARITLRIPVFDGGAAVSVVAALRYRQEKEALAWHLAFLGLEDLVAAAWEAIAERVRDALDVPMFGGAPLEVRF